MKFAINGISAINISGGRGTRSFLSEHPVFDVSGKGLDANES